jgi:hypothetical protein
MNPVKRSFNRVITCSGIRESVTSTGNHIAEIIEAKTRYTIINDKGMDKVSKLHGWELYKENNGGV